MNSSLLLIWVHSFPFVFEQAGGGTFSSVLVLLTGVEEVNTSRPVVAISKVMPVNILFLVFMSAGLGV